MVTREVTVARERLTGRAVAVAPRLLGAVVVSDVGGVRVGIRITEVEAYEGGDDPASHGYRGPTPRTAVMFGPPGHLYCYFTYGMHWCANVVCGEDGVSAAVLLRAGAVVEGVDAARQRRPAARRDVDLARGPARFAACLGVDGDVGGTDLCAPTAPIRVETMRSRAPAGVQRGPRVGITRAADLPWRFWVPGDPTVSAFRSGGRTRQTQGRDRVPRRAT